MASSITGKSSDLTALVMLTVTTITVSRALTMCQVLWKIYSMLSHLILALLVSVWPLNPFSKPSLPCPVCLEAPPGCSSQACLSSFFLAALGLCCYARAFSSYSEPGLLFVALHGLLIAVASRCSTRVLEHAGFSSCGARAQ